MKLEEPHHRERAVTIGVTHTPDAKVLDVSLDTTTLHLKLNDGFAEFLSNELGPNDATPNEELRALIEEWREWAQPWKNSESRDDTTVGEIIESCADELEAVIDDE